MDGIADERMKELEKLFADIFAQAEKEMREKLAEHLKDHEAQKADWQERIKSGDATRSQYRQWLKEQAADRRFIDGMVQRLAEDAVTADRFAADAINDELPYVFAESANMAAFEVETGIGRDTHSFDLYDQSTVRKLVAEEPELYRTVNQDGQADTAWNRRKFTSAITQSIVQGESIPNTAKRLQAVFDMDKNAATRAARTAMTSAENAGRTDSYKRAEKMGIKLEQQWVAAVDMRTRDSHRRLDMEHVKVGEKFSNGLRYPGDPDGAPEEVYNCRCRLVAWFPGIEQEDPERWTKLPEGMTYEEWKNGKQKPPGTTEKARVGNSSVVNGEDILGTWERRKDEFAFEIEDVINAQGFDGKPRIVDADEFDRAVKKANGGDGLIMQRTYSAPDQATLDAYRDMLYDGKWYVDCSTGGAQYGQGMYVAADYTGKLSDGVKEEMQHYIDLQHDRLSTAAAKSAIDAGEIAKRLGADVDSVQATVDFLSGDFMASRRFAKDQGMRARIKSEIEEQLSALKKTVTVPYNVETMTLDPSAKVISWSDALKLQDEATDRFIEQGLTPEQIHEIMPSDIGSFAASKGYDAINANGHGASGSYTVVLNRTKLIIRRP